MNGKREKNNTGKKKGKSLTRVEKRPLHRRGA